MSPLELRPAAVLFDLDGTLADSFSAIHAALAGVLAEEGLPPRSLEWVRRHVGRGAVALVRDAVEEGAAEDRVATVAGAFDARYRALYLERTPPVAGARAVVEAVAARTAGRVAVVSNKFSSLSRGWLERWGFAPSIAAVVGPDTYGVTKPDPATVRPVLARFGVAAADALLVGDMTVDVALGRAVGAPVVAVCGGGSSRHVLEAAGPAAILGALAELPGWLAVHGRGWEGAAARPG